MTPRWSLAALLSGAALFACAPLLPPAAPAPAAVSGPVAPASPAPAADAVAPAPAAASGPVAPASPAPTADAVAPAPAAVSGPRRRHRPHQQPTRSSRHRRRSAGPWRGSSALSARGCSTTRRFSASPTPISIAAQLSRPATGETAHQLYVADSYFGDGAARRRPTMRLATRCPSPRSASTRSLATIGCAYARSSPRRLRRRPAARARRPRGDLHRPIRQDDDDRAFRRSDREPARVVDAARRRAGPAAVRPPRLDPGSGADEHDLFRRSAKEVIARSALGQEVEEGVGLGDRTQPSTSAPRARNASGSMPTVGPTIATRASGRASASSILERGVDQGRAGDQHHIGLGHDLRRLSAGRKNGSSSALRVAGSCSSTTKDCRRRFSSLRNGTKAPTTTTLSPWRISVASKASTPASA